MMNFNIQLFADNLQNTTVTMSKEMKTFYEKRLIDQAEPRLVHDQFADYYPVPQNGGKTIEFRKYDSLPKATTPLTEGVTPNGQALNVTTITSDLHQYGGWTPLTDVLQMTAIDNNEKYIKYISFVISFMYTSSILKRTLFIKRLKQSSVRLSLRM